MPFSHPEEPTDGMNEINMTPLVDVMLVLLVVFIVTIPVVRHAVHLELPRVSGSPLPTVDETLQLSINAAGDYFIDDLRVSDSELLERLQLRVSGGQLPGVQIHGDKDARYERMLNLLSLLQKTGLNRIGFLTNSPPNDD